MNFEYTSTRFLTYRNLMKQIQRLIYAAWGVDKVKFTSAYPKNGDVDNISPPIITYKIISKLPGKYGPSGITERKPRKRETIKVINENGKEIPVDLMGQTFDYIVLFELWAEDGDKADELAEKFQNFMTQYTGYLKKSGVETLFFESMSEEGGDPKWMTDLVKREVSYYFRLDEVVGISSSIFDSFEIETNIYNNLYSMKFDAYYFDEYHQRAKDTSDKETIDDDDDQT